MPMFTTSRIGAPVAPRRSPARIASAMVAMRTRVARIPGITSLPSTSIGAPPMARSAVCSAGRCSLMLTRSPANSASRHAGRPSASACASSRDSVRAVTRSLDTSTHQPSKVKESASKRAGSPAKSEASDLPANSAR